MVLAAGRKGRIMSNEQTKTDAPDLGVRITPPEQEKTTYTLAELLAMEVTELPCLFAPVFLKSGIAVVVGGSDTGKSSLLRQMAMCVATGRDFLGWKYQGEHHRAIYFSSEDDMTITARVIKRYNRTMQLGAEAAQNLRFEFDFNPDNIVERLAAMLKEQPADLVIIDALGDAFNGKNLNDNTEVRKFYAPFKAIAKEANCLIVFNHHTGKRTTAYAPDKDNSLGSQAIEAAPRLAIELREDPNDTDVKHVCIVKANYLSSDHKRQSYAVKMDANLVFAPTGQRTDFAELAKDKKQAKKSANPKDSTNDVHRSFIRSLFAEGEVSQTTLKEQIAAEFGISTKSALDKFEPYYIAQKWIKRNEKGGQYNRVSYSCLI